MKKARPSPVARPASSRRSTPPTATPPPPAPLPDPPTTTPHAARWTFLTNHSHVLILLAQSPAMVLREVAARVGITERAVQRIIADLEEGGFLQRQKIGRQNQYQIRANQPLRHAIEAHRTIGDLVGLIQQHPSAEQ